MKFSILFLFIFIVALVACTQSKNNSTDQHLIDSLEQKINDMYKPGLGEFMSGIQVHHAKLWFAGQNQNWKLADFEVTEMKEALAAIKKYCSDRPETKEIGMIDQSMDSIINAVQQKDLVDFKKGYILLTNTCNSCHQLTSHGFNVIKIPVNPPFSNQEFKVK